MRASRLMLAAMSAALAAESSLGIEFLSTSEQEEIELQRRREAQPVLVCRPSNLAATFARGRGSQLRLEVANGGGQVLRWSISALPEWAQPSPRNGELQLDGRQTIWVAVSDSLDSSSQGRIVLEAPGARGSPCSVPISVTVEQPAETRPVADEQPRRDPFRPHSPEEPNGTRRRAFGVRGGLLAPMAETSATYGVGPLVGVAYAPGGGDRGVRYELGLDIAQVDETSGKSSSFAYAGRFDLLFSGGARASSGRGYLLSGLGFFAESIDTPSGGDTFKVGLLNLGIGYAARGGRVDVRGTYSLLLGSENASGLAGLTLGTSF